MNSAERNVAHGAAYLAGRYGADWYDKIDLGRLDVDVDRDCPLAQLSWTRSFYTSRENRFESTHWLRRHGFVVFGTGFAGLVVGWRGTKRFERRRRLLTQAWRDHVVRLRVARLENRTEVTK